MPINFPDSPTTGDTHTVGDKTWTWDGTAWNVVVSGFPTSISELTITNDLTVDTSTLHVDSTNNRVGIGTASPDDPLHVIGDVTIEVTDDGSAAQPEITLHRESSSPADADYLGQFKFAGKNDAGQTVNYAKITGKISDVTDTTEDGIIEIATIKAGSQNIGYRLTSTDLKLINGTGLQVDGDVGIGTTSPSAKLDVAGDYTSTGHVTAQSGGADGGIVLGQAYSSSYVGLRTAGMSETSGNEYVLITDGNNTFISSGSSGSTYIRGPANDSGNQLRITGTQNLFSGSTYVDGDQVWDRGDLRGGAASVAVSSTGYGTINHGLGATPDFAFVGARQRLSNGSDNQLSFPITSYNSTSITFRAYEINGDGNSNYTSSTIYNATVYVFWMVGNQ